jgi:hypothetical protein
MTTDIAINETITSVLPGDVHTVKYQWSSERETILNIIEVTAISIKMVW